MKIGFARGSARFPVDEQRRQLEAWGAQKVFICDDGETWEDFLGALRKDDEPAVTHIHRIGTSKRDIAEAIAAFADRNLIIYCTVRRCFVDLRCIAEYQDADAYFAGVNRIPTPAIARERAKKSHEARRSKDIFSGKRSASNKIWKDAKVPNDNEATVLINRLLGYDISKATLRRKLGPSGRVRGRKAQD